MGLQSGQGVSAAESQSVWPRARGLQSAETSARQQQKDQITNMTMKHKNKECKFPHREIHKGLSSLIIMDTCLGLLISCVRVQQS